jgi:enterochelin esterase-like enzyme
VVDERSPGGVGSGSFVTETFDYDGGRQVTVYVPPGRAEGIVFAGDGELLATWGAELEGTDVPATMVVGAHHSADETLRLHEYSPGFDPERFTAHENFLVHDVRQWVATRFGVDLPAQRTAAFGVSASAELALALGVRHPRVFGAVLCASPGAGYRPPAVLPTSMRVYLVAGTQEPFFLENATRWATALVNEGAEVVVEERLGSHGGDFWRREFPVMVAWALAR